MQVSANSHNFRFRLPVLHNQNLSNLCRHKHNSWISRFFKNLILGGFWPFGPTVKLSKLVLGFLSMKRNFVCGLDDEGVVRRDAKLCTFTLCNVVDTR